MAKITKSLTDTEIRAAVAGSKPISLFDGKGLMLLIQPNGSKLWRYRYKHPAKGTRVMLGIGRYPEMTLAEARKKRDQGNTLLATVDNKTGVGIDPQTHWKEQKFKAKHDHINTFEQVAKAWHEIKSSEVSEGHAIDVWRSIERDLLPSIGNSPINALNARDLIRAMDGIKARGALETIRRLCQRINEIMEYAANIGLITSNPATGINKAFKRPQENNFPSIKPFELPLFLQTLSRTNIAISTRCVIEFQLHTMTRPNEAAGARWDEIDFTSQMWTIPAERMKRNKAHSIPLTEQSLAILAVMKPHSGHREHIFVGSKNPRKPTHVQTANAAIKRMGYKNKLVAHGLRSLASTTLNEQGFDPDIIESALAHVDKNEVRRVYNRAEYLERRRTMMCWWSNRIDEAATDKVTVAGNAKTLSVVGE